MKNDNDQNFDNYVNKLLSEDTAVPNGLEWGKMDIAIPKKKSKRPAFFLLLAGMLVMFSITAGYFYQSQSAETEKTNNQIVDKQLESIEESNTITTAAASHDLDTQECIEQSIGITSTEELLGNNSPIEKKRQLKTISITSQGDRDPNKIEQSTQELGLAVDGIRTSNLVFSSPISNPVNLVNTGKIQLPLVSKETPLFIGPVALIAFNTSFLNVEKRSLTGLRFPRLSAIDKTSGVTSNLTWFINAGSNYNTLAFHNHTVFEDKTEQLPGLSFQLGLEKALIKKMTSYISFNYNEAHTGFRHSREVSRAYSVVTNSYTILCEHTYHNNYSKMIDFRMGLGRIFRTSERFDFKTNLAVSTGFLLSKSGKTLLHDGTISFIDEIDSSRAFNLGISPSIDLRYKLSSKFSISGSYHFTHSLVNSYYINEHVDMSSLHQLMMGLRFSL